MLTTGFLTGSARTAAQSRVRAARQGGGREDGGAARGDDPHAGGAPEPDGARRTAGKLNPETRDPKPQPLTKDAGIRIGAGPS